MVRRPMSRRSGRGALPERTRRDPPGRAAEFRLLIAGVPVTSLSWSSGPLLVLRWVIKLRRGKFGSRDPGTALLPDLSGERRAAGRGEARRRATRGKAKVQSVAGTRAEDPPMDLRADSPPWQVTMNDGAHFYVETRLRDRSSRPRTRWMAPLSHDFMWVVHIMDPRPARTRTIRSCSCWPGRAREMSVSRLRSLLPKASRRSALEPRLRLTID
jgi:hypothetical protein